MKVGKRLVYGVGINDADYVTQVKETVRMFEGEREQEVIWLCPFYVRWTSMLARCYSEKQQLKQPTYRGCSVTSEWLTFTNFKSWMEQQDWEGKELDKDILFPGNKVYGPEACVFVDRKVNLFIIESTSGRGEYPIGVDFSKTSGKFRAQCNSVNTGQNKHLGSFNTAEEAHKAWLAYKLSQAHILADEQTDERVAEVLAKRYENYAECA